MINLLKGSRRLFDVEFTEWKLNFSDNLCREYEGTFWTLEHDGSDLYLKQVEHEKGLPVAPNGRMKGFIRVLLEGKNPKETQGLWGKYDAQGMESNDGKYVYLLSKIEDDEE